MLQGALSRPLGSPSLRRGAALLLLLGCALACKSAWKADGSAFVFPFVMGEDLQGLAQHDLATGKTTRLHVGGKGETLRPFYGPDGALFFLAGRKKEQGSIGWLRVLERSADGAVKERALFEHVDPSATFLGDPVFSGGRLYLSVDPKGGDADGMRLARVDLATGKTSRLFPDRFVWLFAGAAGSFYVEFHPAERESDPKAFTVGRFDPGKEALVPLSGRIDGEVAWPMLTVGQAHVALVVKASGGAHLAVFEAKGGRRHDIPLPSEGGWEPTQVAFGPGDRMAYLGAAKDRTAYVAIPCDIERRTVRLDAAVPISTEKTTERLFAFTPSPTGSHIAVTHLSDKRCDAYVIDLTKEKPVVTAIHVPR